MDIANPKISEMNGIVGRIRLACAAVGAFRDSLEENDREMLDYMVDATNTLHAKFTEIISQPAAADPGFDLGRKERHDLRNNITAILGFGELLLQCYTDPQVMIQQLDRLRDDAKRFTDLTMPPEVASATAS